MWQRLAFEAPRGGAPGALYTPETMNRRQLLQAGLTASAALGPIASTSAASQEAQGSERRFKLRFAPHFGMFKHHAGDDIIDQLKFMADEGFVALEDNWLARRDPAEQERIGKALDDLGMAMGVLVAHADFRSPTFASRDAELWKAVESDLRNAVAAAKRVGAKWCTVVPGSLVARDPMDYQMAQAVDNLRRAADILEPEGVVAVLEPLNPWRDHAGCFLTGIPQAYSLCRAVNRPSIKILDDLYHQQITEGNLIPNLDRAWDEIGYIQVGDNPGRKEPTTGEINYRNVFDHIARKGYTGIIGMEHGNSRPGKEGERALIDAYVQVGGV